MRPPHLAIHVFAPMLALLCGCAVKPLNVQDRSTRFPPAVHSIGKYQLIPPAMNTPTGMALGPQVAEELRRIMGPSISPDALHALYITNLEMTEKDSGGNLIIAVAVTANVALESGSENKQVMRADVNVEVEFKKDADRKEARDAAIAEAAKALAKQLP